MGVCQEQFKLTLLKLETLLYKMWIANETLGSWVALRAQGNPAEADSLKADLVLDHAAYREAAYQKAVDLCPETASFQSKLGKSLTAQGKSAAAVVAYQNAIALDYRPFETNLQLGDALFEQGKFDLAEKAYKAALALHTPNTAYLSPWDDLNLYLAMGELYLTTDRLDLALDFYQRASKESPYNDEIAEKVEQLQQQ